MFAGVGGRTVALGYSGSDGVRQQFTSKERDIETGLDYFLARYYSSVQGRFTGVDPDNYQARLNPTDPQSWNAYSYVNNNPLGRVDPDGRGFFSKLKNLFWWGVWGEEQDVQREEDKRRQTLANQQKQNGGELIIENLGGDLILVLAHGQDVSTLSRRQVFFWTNRLMEIREQGGGSRPLRPDEQVFDAASTISPVLRGDPYHPESVQQRQAEWNGLKRQMNARLAKQLGLNVHSRPSQQLLDNLDSTVDSFISQYRKAGIRAQMPSEFLGKTIKEALESGDSTVRKLLIDKRWAK